MPKMITVNRSNRPNLEGGPLINWGAAAAQGAETAVMVSNQIHKNRQMNQQTEALRIKNTMDAMTLEEKAIFWQEKRKALKNGHAEAQMKSAVATETHRLASIEAQAESSEISAGRVLISAKERKDAMGLLDAGRNAIARKNPADMRGVLAQLEHNFPNASNDDILQMKRQLTEGTEESMKGIYAAAEKAEAETPGSGDHILQAGIERFASSASNPGYTPLVVGSMAGDVKTFKEGMKNKREWDHDVKVREYMQASGVTDRAVAEKHFAEKDRMARWNINTESDINDINIRKHAVQMGNFRISVGVQEAILEGKGELSQAELAKDITVLSGEFDELKVRNAQKRLRMQKELQKRKKLGVERELGGKRFADVTAETFWTQPFVSLSSVQNNLHLEIESRIQELSHLASNSSPEKSIEYQKKIKQMKDAQKETGAFGWFNKKDYESTGQISRHLKDLKDKTNGFNADGVKAGEIFTSMVYVLDEIYKPESTFDQEFQYQMKAMENQEKYFSTVLNGLSEHIYDNTRPAGADIVAPD